jgi:RND family efflux transporter MFP subunit
VTPSVKVFVVGKQATGQSRRISGKVDAAERSTLSFGVNGRVLEIIAVKGQTISKGQLLARLDDEPFRLKLADARTRLNTARATLVEANAMFDRIDNLVKRRAATQKDLDAATRKLATADGDVRSAQSALAQAELDLARTRLTAPFAGQVVDVPVDPFQEVAASEAVVALQVAGALEVNVLVPETLIRDVDYGQAVQVTFPTLSGVKVPGLVTKIGAEAEAGNAFAVTVILQESDTDLRSGMTASVTFNFNAYLGERTAFLIPLSAIAIEAGLRSSRESSAETESSGNRAPVFVFDPASGKIQLQELVVGDLRGNEIEVYEGLQPGDQVVSAGVAFLRAVVCLAGTSVYFTQPRQEDPEVTLRSAQVVTQVPGLSPERIEQLVTRPIEDAVKSISEVDEIKSLSMTGLSIVMPEAASRYTDMAPIWADLRNKMDDLAPRLPEGAVGPQVNDDFGRVAVITLALTGSEYTMAELYSVARDIQKTLSALPLVARVDLFGVQPEHIWIEIDAAFMAQFGISPDNLVAALRGQNIALPGGMVEAQDQNIVIEPSGDFRSVDDIRTWMISPRSAEAMQSLRNPLHFSTASRRLCLAFRWWRSPTSSNSEVNHPFGHAPGCGDLSARFGPGVRPRRDRQPPADDRSGAPGRDGRTGLSDRPHRRRHGATDGATDDDGNARRDVHLGHRVAPSFHRRDHRRSWAPCRQRRRRCGGHQEAPGRRG